MKIQNEIEIFRDKQAQITDQITENGNDPIYLGGWEGGLVGWDVDENGFVHAVYSEELMLDFYCRMNGCDYEEAYEFYEYNTIRSLPYIGEANRPRIIHTAL